MIALGHDNNVTLYLGSDAVLKAYLGTELVYPNTTPSYDTQYLTFEAIDNGTSFQFNQNGLEYSLDDGSTWNSLGASVHTPSLNTGDKIMFRGNMSITQGYGIGQFSSNGHFNIEGNPLSLVDDTNFADITDFTGMNQIFFQLFYGTDVVDASNIALPATTLSQDCYTSMFNGCRSLTTAPELPATTLAEYCYSYMFSGCTSLTTAPELPAETLAEYCYNRMFNGCRSLTTAPELPATTLARNCYCYMFQNTNVLPDTSNIDFTSQTVLASGGLIGLFGGTKVTDADLMRILPKNSNNKYCLPATTLADSCYREMFSGCRSLTTAPELPATTLAGNCYSHMFQNCTNLTTAPVLPATTLVSNCYTFMFFGCTNLTTAPVLPARTLVSSCYSHMFYNCTNLNYIKAMFTTTPSTSYTQNWVSGVAATGTFVKNSAATWNVTGVYGVPSGWTIKRASQ